MRYNSVIVGRNISFFAAAILYDSNDGTVKQWRISRQRELESKRNYEPVEKCFKEFRSTQV